MSGDAIFDTTRALKTRLEAVNGVGTGKVYVGLPHDVDAHLVSLFLYNVTPNRDLRNAERFAQAPAGGPGNPALRPVDALPLDLRYLVSVFRASNPSPEADPNELKILGAIMLALHKDPVLTGSLIPGQTVRLTPEPCSVEELNRIWGLFPQDNYRTSVVYLASPVFIEADLARGVAVQSRSLREGIAEPSAGVAA